MSLSFDPILSFSSSASHAPVHTLSLTHWLSLSLSHSHTHLRTLSLSLSLRCHRQWWFDLLSFRHRIIPRNRSRWVSVTCFCFFSVTHRPHTLSLTILNTHYTTLLATHTTLTHTPHSPQHTHLTPLNTLHTTLLHRWHPLFSGGKNGLGQTKCSKWS